MNALASGGCASLWNNADNACGLDQAQVVIRQQGECTPALARTMVEHNGPSLGDRHSARGQHPVRACNRLVGQALIAEQVKATRLQVSREIGR
jgi:hypothetical protein